VRPDTFYGASKVAGEALGRLYADKHGLEVVAIRVVGFANEPLDAGFIWGWLSPRDCVQLFRRSLEAEGVSYLCLYGRSRNARARWATDGWDTIGYEPEDDAEVFADRYDLSEPPYPYQGMRFPDLEPEP
jgi:uronate dehydrogenase